MTRCLHIFAFLFISLAADAAQKAAAPNAEDLASMRSQRASVEQYLSPELAKGYHTAKGKLLLLQAFLQEKKLGPEKSDEVTGVGIVFGDVFVQTYGMEWVFVESQRGRDPVLRVPTTDAVFDPIGEISKRIERGKAIKIFDLYGILSDKIDALQKGKKDALTTSIRELGSTSSWRDSNGVDHEFIEVIDEERLERLLDFDPEHSVPLVSTQTIIEAARAQLTLKNPDVTFTFESIQLNASGYRVGKLWGYDIFFSGRHGQNKESEIHLVRLLADGKPVDQRELLPEDRANPESYVTRSRHMTLVEQARGGPETKIPAELDRSAGSRQD